MTLDLLIYDAAWAHGFRLDELGYSTGSPADARTPASDWNAGAGCLAGVGVV